MQLLKPAQSMAPTLTWDCLQVQKVKRQGRTARKYPLLIATDGVDLYRSFD